MKAKKLLISLAIFATSLISVSATTPTLLVSEDFSSAAWAAELAAVPAVPTYVKPIVGGNFQFLPLLTSYTCFGKYVITNQVISVFDGLVALTNPTNTCALFATQGIVHADVTNLAVGFRFRSNGTSIFEFPEIASAGKMTIHVKNGNTTTATTLTLQKWDATLPTPAWVAVYAFPLSASSVYLTNTLDEVVTYNISSQNPIKLRLTGATTNTSLFRVDIEEYSTATGLDNVKSNSFKLTDRKLIAEQPGLVSIYNTSGKMVFQKNIENEIELPITITKGLYLVKCNNYTQKILLN